jgi:hypothetical protein
MRTAGWCLAILLSVSVQYSSKGNEPSEEYFRAELFELNTDSRKAVSFINEINEYSGYNALLTAYLGAAQAHAAKASSNPFSKYNYIRKAHKNLKKAASRESSNLEIRFLRFSVQSQIPSVLGMKQNIKEDKAFIISNLKDFNWSAIDVHVREYIINFMLQSNECTDQDRFYIKRHLADQ